MSLEAYVAGMPRIELFLQLEGALPAERMLGIADQSGLFDGGDALEEWRQRLAQPDVARRHELMAELSQWLRYEDDVAHVVYEIGLALARQQVLYAEVHFNPAHFTEHGWSFEKLLAALNDGRRRVALAWKVELRWVLSIFRDQPRHADEAVRLAGSAEGIRGGIVGICLGGPEAAQPPGQFERAFRTAARKGVPTAVHANGSAEAAGTVREQLEILQPQRLIGGYGVAGEPELAAELARRETALVATMSEAQALGLVAEGAAYPLRQLADEGLRLFVSSGLPLFYGRSLADEQRAAALECGLGVDELQAMALNAAGASWLPEEEKAALEQALRERMSALEAEAPDAAG